MSPLAANSEFLQYWNIQKNK